jgi:hypothetical protein
MPKRRSSKRVRRTKRRHTEEQPAALAATPQAAPTGQKRLGPPYAAGPVLRLDSGPVAGTIAHQPDDQRASDRQGNRAEPGLAPLPTVEGSGPMRHERVHGGSIRLEGRTDANFRSNYRTRGVQVERATGCEGCPDNECIHVTGTLVATYSVTTRVTLPSADDYPDLTPCQRRRVQNAIDNVLAPHEQEHVRAFRQYNGITRRQFDLTLCRSAFDSAISAMFDAEEEQRRRAARAASDALDPFHFDVDLDCEDEQQSSTDDQHTPAAPPET